MSLQNPNQWNPTQYLRFGNHRLRPVLDLIDRISLDAPSAIYDLGCGTGAGTVLLKERWPEARVTGLDSSESMLERTRGLDADVTWLQADLNTWTPEQPADLLFSNAVLHWLDDHESLFPRLIGCLKSGGVLAVQMPENFSAPSHTLIAQTVRNGEWRERLETELREHPVLDPQKYYDLISGLASSFDMWETTYHHVLEGDDPVVEWTRGSILTSVLAKLEDAEKELFLEAYRKPAEEAYPRRSDGKTILPFKRLFMVAVK